MRYTFCTWPGIILLIKHLYFRITSTCICLLFVSLSCQRCKARIFINLIRMKDLRNRLIDSSQLLWFVNTLSGANLLVILRLGIYLLKFWFLSSLGLWGLSRLIFCFNLAIRIWLFPFSLLTICKASVYHWKDWLSDQVTRFFLQSR